MKHAIGVASNRPYRPVRAHNITSKLNKNCKGLGTTEKEKKQEETQTGQ